MFSAETFKNSIPQIMFFINKAPHITNRGALFHQLHIDEVTCFEEIFSHFFEQPCPIQRGVLKIANIPQNLDGIVLLGKQDFILMGTANLLIEELRKRYHLLLSKQAVMIWSEILLQIFLKTCDPVNHLTHFYGELYNLVLHLHLESPFLLIT